MTGAALKKRALDVMDQRRDEFVAISKTLHANPELSFQEFKASALLCDVLEKNGFAVRRGVGTLATAFRAELGGKGEGPTIAILAEYDALPEIGHACGHNLMAAAAVGAAIGLRAVMEALPGRVVVIGTPAEEKGGGKGILIKNGVFADVDAAMIVHPSARTFVARRSLASMNLNLEFRGRAAHAASAPDEGINALEAVILTFNNINAMRLHWRSDARVHGIITNGGSAVNVIPDYAAATFSIRAATQKYAEKIVERVIVCAEAAGLATGAPLKHETIPGCAEMWPNPVLASLFADNWRALGVPVSEPRPTERIASTDMGNVSHVVPSLHPYIAIGPEGMPGHTIEFREAAVSPAGHAGMIQAAKGMAMTAIDLLSNIELVKQAKQALADQHR
jgi:amidohydrolase